MLDIASCHVQGRKIDLFTTKRIKQVVPRKPKVQSHSIRNFRLSPSFGLLGSSMCLPLDLEPVQCHSFLHMVKVVEMLQATQLGQVTPAELQYLGGTYVVQIMFYCDCEVSF